MYEFLVFIYLRCPFVVCAVQPAVGVPQRRQLVVAIYITINIYI